ncbi:SUKH superfamily protein [Tenacibaculum sp. 190130A14a]|uniref:Antitoxin YobK n=1 Tax=Tenacibaculum polynesiense TaxID=3137857 RepID=A0ABP1EUX7_9FLAO
MFKGILIFILIVSFLVTILNQKNEQERKETKKKMKEGFILSNKIASLEQSSYTKHSITKHSITKPLILLLEDSYLHSNIGEQLTDINIKVIEKELGLSLPVSYKIFLQYFGDGADWLYHQSIDSAKNIGKLKEYRRGLGAQINWIGEKELEVDTILCLMTEDSNGGAWCWITSEVDENGEWPLAYFNREDGSLYFKIENFTEWLKTLVASKSEVIRALDTEDKLGLG